MRTKENYGCAIITFIVTMIFIAWMFMLLTSCSAYRVTDEDMVQWMDQTTELWSQYKQECYADSVEWCEYTIDMETGEEDSICWFEHKEVTYSGFMYFLSNTDTP